MTIQDQEIQKGFDMFNSGQRRQAIEFLSKSAMRHPKAANVQQAAGMVYFLDAKYKDAEIYFKRSYAIDPNHPIHLHSLGKLFAETERVPEGRVLVEQALKNAPQFAEAWQTLSSILSKSEEPDLAAEALLKAIELEPQNPDLAIAMGVLLHKQDPELAFEHLRSSIHKFPQQLDLHQLVCAEANYLSNIKEEEILMIHRDFAKKVQERCSPQKNFSHDRDPERPLKIGVLCSDMRLHSVSFFLLPLLRGLKNYGHHVFCYNIIGVEDEVTKTYRREFTFRDRDAASAEGYATKIFSDQIDILLDVNGYTIGGFPEISALRPAPITVGAIGYPQTTGNTRTQYRLGDADADPLEADQTYSEKILRLDRPFLCFEALHSLPDIGPKREGSIVFGSFNSAAKITPKTVKRWARILKSVPESTLILKYLGFNEPGYQKRIAGFLEAEGISDQVQFFEPQKSVTEHLSQYQMIDVALDPVPYNGTTTSLEALLMGVPVLCEWGQVHRSRTSAMLVKAVGHPEWAGQSEDEMIQIAQDLAKNLSGIREGREALRNAVLNSSLCDQVGYAQAVNDAFRSAWREFCAE